MLTEIFLMHARETVRLTLHNSCELWWVSGSTCTGTLDMHITQRRTAIVKAVMRHAYSRLVQYAMPSLHAGKLELGMWTKNNCCGPLPLNLTWYYSVHHMLSWQVWVGQPARYGS